MKRLIQYLLVAAMAATFVSCGKDDDAKFDEGLVPGYWVIEDTTIGGKTGDDYWFFKADHTGYSWFTGDDVAEEEAQPFTWALSGDQLNLIQKGEMGQDVPKYYTVTRLTSTVLEMTDGFKERSFRKTTKP